MRLYGGTPKGSGTPTAVTVVQGRFNLLRIIFEPFWIAFRPSLDRCRITSDCSQTFFGFVWPFAHRFWIVSRYFEIVQIVFGLFVDRLGIVFGSFSDRLFKTWGYHYSNAP